MSYKSASYITPALLAAVAIAYLWAGPGLSDPRNRGGIGPAYFPTLLGVLMLVLCGLSAVRTWMSDDDRHIAVPNLGLVAASAGLTALFLLAWQFFHGYFYALALVFCFGLMLLFGRGKGMRSHVIGLASSVAIVAGIYGLFGYAMQIRF